MLGIYALCALDAASPCYITNVFPTSQLVQCGVQSGDLLLQINGKSPFDYLHTAHPTNPGATISITFQHESITKTVSVKLSDMRTFVPFLQSYSQWQKSHMPFLKEQHDKYRGCALI
jgi:predicted metalloprotease with PDZ domain